MTRIDIVIASERALLRQAVASSFQEPDVVDWGDPAWTVGTSPVLAAAR